MRHTKVFTIANSFVYILPELLEYRLLRNISEVIMKFSLSISAIAITAPLVWFIAVGIYTCNSLMRRAHPKF